MSSENTPETERSLEGSENSNYHVNGAFEYGGEDWSPIFRPYSGESDDSFLNRYKNLFAEDLDLDTAFYEHIQHDAQEEQAVEGEVYETESSEAEESSSTPKVEAVVVEQQRRKSLFVHSCPSNFPAINRARKSVFGSIFLKTSGQPAEDNALLRTIADSNYSMLQSLLNSFERILTSVPSDSERKRLMMAYKQSIIGLLESHGIRKTFSDGSVHWDIYPIAQSNLYTIQVGDRIHQTRNLSKMEDRILAGSIQSARLPYEWPTDSIWTGNWDALGMSGSGLYLVPHGVSYNGKMQDGMFHDTNATLTYPNKFKAINCVYEKGILKDCQFQFPDNLLHEKENWGYCKSPDRRFWSEVKKGLRPAKIAQKTEIDPSRKIPDKCYDTGEGFYNPKTLALTGPTGELLRVPLCEEDLWIKNYCRKGFAERTNFRPDLFENWFNNDEALIQSILDQHKLYRSRKITYHELQQFYADHGILPEFSRYKKRLSPSEIELKELQELLEDPIHLKKPRVVKKNKGHRLTVLTDLDKNEDYSMLMDTPVPKIKSLLRFGLDSKQKVGTVSVRSSKISFKVSQDSVHNSAPSSPSTSKNSSGASSSFRKIPPQYLQPLHIMRPPFMSKYMGINKQQEKLSKCSSKRKLSEEIDFTVQPTNENLEKNLKKFMKSIIMGIVKEILLKEREKYRQRLLWASDIPKTKSKRQKRMNQSLKLLQEMFESIPDKDEYCDSDPSKVCNLKQFAEDKYNVMKYWGTRMFYLQFEKEKSNLK